MNFFSDNLIHWHSIAPFISMYIGWSFFLAPRRKFNHLGFEGVEQHPEAFGEGRSTFAGFLIASSFIAFAVRDPVVYFLLGAAWAFSSFGKLLHIGLDGARSKSVFLRLLMALILAGLFFASSTTPQFDFKNALQISNLLPMICAIVTLLFGIMCLFLPKASLSIMRLRAMEAMPSAIGEVRGNVAGFYLAAALGVMFVDNLYALLILGFGWLVTAFGRVISMLSDGTNNMFNWVSLLVEFLLAFLPLVVAFGLV